ncbi:molybdate ABC transporter substrate-binding protein [Microbacterium sp.]|uniref:molybdate ABC transporter substrate-binding protein n=1 Tax=Microbacterium sp. TaxID=51671 RepID=UPI00281179B0|nr:molybdate ABC transporter substrate-binding protein [Microbacterium sp.]
MSRSLRRSAVVLAAAAAAVLAGCSAGAAPTPDGAERAPSGDLVVYAAASLSAAFDAIGDAFTAEHPGVKMSHVYDGSPTLVTQLLEGAPADVIATADDDTMAQLDSTAGEPSVFASNTLVIAVPTGNPGDVQTLADLADGVTVLCDAAVPCGAASATLLENAGIALEPASLEQNVTAVLTKVTAGEADAGLVYATDAIGRDDVETIVPAGAEEVVVRYPIATLTDARNPGTASAFVNFVLSDAGQAILADFGFGTP